MPEYDKRENADIESVLVLVRRLEIIVSGSTDYNVPGLVPTVKEISRKLDTLTADFVIMRQHQIFNRRLLIGAFAFSFLLMIGLGLLVYRMVGL